MDQTGFRREAANRRDGRVRLGASLSERPDRVALWAVALAVVAMIAGAASAHAGSSGGAGFDGGSAAGSGSVGTGDCSQTELGKRALKDGDCGDDVQTLNWILKSKDYHQVSLDENFAAATEAAVRQFERDAAIRENGVVEDETTSALVASMPSQVATWYGPGFWGNETACGETLERGTVGVAHKTLPCGSKVVIRYNGAYLRTQVIDRGPYSNDAKWDLTQRAARLVGLEYTDEIRVAKLAKGGKRK